MKKYKVSIAVNIPHNFEVEVEAKNEYEAYEKGMAEMDNKDTAGEVVETDLPPVVDISDPDKDGDIPNGVSVEEVVE